jgi:hypothetical protein
MQTHSELPGNVLVKAFFALQTASAAKANATLLPCANHQEYNDLPLHLNRVDRNQIGRLELEYPLPLRPSASVGSAPGTALTFLYPCRLQQLQHPGQTIWRIV